MRVRVCVWGGGGGGGLRAWNVALLLRIVLGMEVGTADTTGFLSMAAGLGKASALQLAK